MGPGPSEPPGINLHPATVETMPKERKEEREKKERRGKERRDKERQIRNEAGKEKDDDDHEEGNSARFRPLCACGGGGV